MKMVFCPAPHTMFYWTTQQSRREGSTQVKWRSSIESRTVSKFPGFVWITVVQEMEEQFRNNSSKLAEQNKEKKQT